MNHRRSEEFYQQALSLMPGGVNSPVRSFKGVGGAPLFIARGEGAFLYDVDDNRYIDYVMSWGPLILGHAHPAVIQAIQQQASLGTSYGAPTPLENELAMLIQQAMPSLELLRFVNSGTEAAMSALRLARAFTGRSKIIKFEGCYHGHADMLLVQAGSGGATLGIPDSAGVPYSVVEDTLLAPFNEIGAVQTLFEQFSTEVAAIIVEPIAGNMGMILPQEGFLEFLKNIASQYGALLIFDEVMTGFRVHPHGAQGLYNISPDITILGKIIGGGLPVGAYGGRAEIMAKVAPLGPMYQAGTLSGNPLAMAAGIATLKTLFSNQTFDSIAENTAHLAQELVRLARRNGIEFQSVNMGAMFGFFLSNQPIYNFTTAKKSNVLAYAQLFHHLLHEGIYLPPSAFEAAFASLAHRAEIIEGTLRAFDSAFKKLGG